MHWWQTAVIYQIYPRSFQDSDGDGVGDLPGIVARLPYLAELGVDALWLSPIFVSPMADFGYDISDYNGDRSAVRQHGRFRRAAGGGACARHQGAARLRSQPHLRPASLVCGKPGIARKREARLVHLARSARPMAGRPTTGCRNSAARLGAFDEATGQYYYHAFLSAQPDLNWRNADVRAAMHDVMRFWLRRGVDGFRVDVMWHLIKDDAFRDNPPNPDFRAGEPPYRRLLPLYSADRPEVHDVVRGLRAVIDEFPERVLIGEIYLPIERLVAYYGRGLSGAHLPFNFSLLETPWRARAIAQSIDRYEAALPAGGWPNWVLGNHDRPRLATRTRAGAGARRGHAAADAARHADALLRRRDRHAAGGDAPEPRAIRPRCMCPAATAAARRCSGTPAPLPDSRAGEPWLPLAEDFAANNVARQRAEPGVAAQSLPAADRLAPRAAGSDAWRLSADSRPTDDVLAFMREEAGDRVLVALNFAAEAGGGGLCRPMDPGDRPALVGRRTATAKK